MYARNKYGLKIDTWVETTCMFSVLPDVPDFFVSSEGSFSSWQSYGFPDDWPILVDVMWEAAVTNVGLAAPESWTEEEKKMLSF